MPLSAGDKLGPYEILAPIGAGGMGDVYKARDTRLDRIVAIKVSRTEFSERFEREARAVAALNHPNICTLHDVGPNYLVMEYVEGSPIASPDNLRKLLDVAVQIGDGLAAAHAMGLIHRDLKPDNILVARDGRVKILDFGLAKTATSAVNQESDSTRTIALTDSGTTIGTVNYMSPEQARGLANLTAQSDQFSFGLVLYELAAGKRAFRRASAAETLTAIIREDAEPLPASTPAFLRWVIERLLSKDPADRYDSTRDLYRELKQIRDRSSEATSAQQIPVIASSQGRLQLRFKTLPWVAAALLLATTLTLVVADYRRAPPPARILKFSVAPPDKATIELTSPVTTSLPALSPDGRRLVFAAARDGKIQLWLRDMDSLAARLLEGSDGASHPFWSPDSHFVAFFARGKLKKLDIAGGPPLTLCDAPLGRGGSWNQSDVIIFAPALATGLSRIPAAGGTPAALTTIDQQSGENSHRFPWFLPDGRHFLYTARRAETDKTQIYVGDLQSKERRLVVTAASNAVYSPPGFLLYWRDGNLIAQSFDASSARATGDPVPIAEQVDYVLANVQGQFTVSQTGVLAYNTAGVAGESQLTWFGRDGKEEGPVGLGSTPALSPDGKTVAFGRRDPSTGFGDVWLHDLARGTDTRLTFNSRSSGFPAWAPDGKYVVFGSDRDGVLNLFKKDTNGSGGEEPLLEQSAFGRVPSDWSRDGRFVIFSQIDPKTSNDIWGLPLVKDGKPFPIVQTRFNDRLGKLSPDGHWLAYVSDEIYRAEVYVRNFTGGSSESDGKWQISTAGGTYPVWRRDGRELFYMAADRTLTAVEIALDLRFQAGPSKPLFKIPFALDASFGGYDVNADGTRFLLATHSSSDPSAPMTVVDNWTAMLKK